MPKKQDKKISGRNSSAEGRPQSGNKKYNKDDKIKSDVLGSYTGRPEKGEQPTQDADDL